jgi:hypothetical protein
MNVLHRIRGIILSPGREWRVIERESGEPSYVFGRYVAVLALIPAIFGFIGKSVIGVTVSAGSFRVPVLPGLVDAVLSYMFAFVIVYVTALIIDLLARYFDADRYFPNALKLAAYSFTPVWLSGFFLVLPGLQFLTLFGLYSLILLWLGLPVLLRAPRASALLYAIAVGVLSIAFIFALAYLQAMIVAIPAGVTAEP